MRTVPVESLLGWWVVDLLSVFRKGGDKATTWEERMRVGGTALVSLAAELTGATSVWSACKK
jgi:hypothetical protein